MSKMSLLDLPRDMLNEILMVRPGVYFVLSRCCKQLNELCVKLKDKANKKFPRKHIQKIDSWYSLRKVTTAYHPRYPPLSFFSPHLPDSVEYITYDGLKEGELKGYYKGYLILIIEFVRNVPHGNYKWWYPKSEQLLFEANIVNNTLHGNFETYHSDGEVYANGTIEN